MSELTTVARPYAKAAFDFAVEAKAVDSWLDQLTFAAEVAKDEPLRVICLAVLQLSKHKHYF